MGRDEGQNRHAMEGLDKVSGHEQEASTGMVPTQEWARQDSCPNGEGKVHKDYRMENQCQLWNRRRKEMVECLSYGRLVELQDTQNQRIICCHICNYKSLWGHMTLLSSHWETYKLPSLLICKVGKCRRSGLQVTRDRQSLRQFCSLSISTRP